MSTEVQEGGADEVIQKMFALEAATQYKSEWDLFTADCRRSLAKTSNLSTADQYQEYRRGLEALWSDFSITSRSVEGRGRVVYTGHAKVDETGLASDATFGCLVVREGTAWKIDSFTYSTKPVD